MQSSITLIRFSYEEPYHLNLIMKATNGQSTGELEFYDNRDSLKDCAKALMNFPKNAKDEFIWELGSEDEKDRFLFFFRFRAYVTDPTGKCAINLRFNNNRHHPDLVITEFSIKAEAAGVNNLGKLLKNFSDLKTEKLFWDGRDGELS